MFEYIIGLEIHIKLSTKQGLFCMCENSQDFDTVSPNTNICPICTAQPGALPVLNPEAVDFAIRLGKIFGSEYHKNFKRDRKSYFYPDLPMGFQITQFDRPIMVGGSLSFFSNNFTTEHTIHIHEAHLENDTAKTITINGTTFIDFNRSGTPLIEIVTKPEFTSEDEVIEFLKEIQRVVRFNNVGFADLEKGQMRVDVNISIKKQEDKQLGTRVEVKNINSFAAIRRAIQFEFKRHVDLINQGAKITQETRRRDDESGTTQSMRSKEQAMDYRYFPENDIPECNPTQFNRDPDITIDSGYLRIKSLKEYGFQKEYIYGLINNDTFYTRFASIVKDGIEPKVAAKRILGPIAAVVNNEGMQNLTITKDDLLFFLQSLKKENIAETIAKQIMEKILTGESAKIVIQSCLSGKKNINVNELCIQVIEQFPDIVNQYKNGKTTTIMFLVGQVMKLGEGSLNPQNVRSLLESMLL